MTTTPINVVVQFEQAEQLPEEHDIQTYGAWRNGLERQYNVMPSWYWNETKCRENYAAYVQSVMDWQTKQAEHNRLAQGLHDEIRRAI